MIANRLFEQLTESLQAMFHKGSRFQAEKIGIVAAYAVLAVGSFVWATTGESRSNELGADFGRTTIGQLDQQLLFVENKGRKAWTDVRIVLNERYLYTADKIPGRQREVLEPGDFEYFYYIPRPWGQNEWEGLIDEPRPEAKAPNSITPRFVQIRASQGRVDLEPEP